VTGHRFVDKVAVVTGGTIGHRSGDRRAAPGRGRGGRVLRRRAELRDELVATLGPQRAVFVVADVTTRSDLESLFRTVTDDAPDAAALEVDDGVEPGRRCSTAAGSRYRCCGARSPTTSRRRRPS
jgi:NAD(P)-dependent dehydrogenase (short-subunit alcohol dehydrogenase family)